MMLIGKRTRDNCAAGESGKNALEIIPASKFMIPQAIVHFAAMQFAGYQIWSEERVRFVRNPYTVFLGTLPNNMGSGSPMPITPTRIRLAGTMAVESILAE